VSVVTTIPDVMAGDRTRAGATITRRQVAYPQT